METDPDVLDLDRFLADDYQRVIRSVALACGSSQLAGEAVHEAIARAIEADRRGQVIDNPAAWITVVGIRWTNRWHRRRRTEEAGMLSLNPLLTGHTTAEEARFVDLRRGVASLPLRQRQATVLFYFHDFDVAATAAALGVSTGTVKSALSRARATLAHLLGEADPVDHAAHRAEHGDAN